MPTIIERRAFTLLSMKFIAHFQPELVAQFFRHDDFPCVGGVGKVGEAALGEASTQIAPVVAVVHASIHHALEIFVGFQNSGFFRNQAHALHFAEEQRIGLYAIKHLMGIDGGIVVVHAKPGVAHL